MSIEGIEKFANILGADTIKKIYEDGLSESVQETGKTSTDFIKAARLFTAPIQYLGAYQDRLTKHLNKVREGVPEERQIEAPTSLSGPIMDRLKYLEDENYLTDLYLSLLQRAIDKERINEAHPAFFHIIEQLSPDEAFLLHNISQNPIEYEYTMDLIEKEDGKIRFENSNVIKDTSPKENIVFSEHFDMYISHLESLNLLKWIVSSEEPIFENSEDSNKGKQTGIHRKTSIYLTKFGDLFAKACIPENKIFILK
ncbi:Abi-alpha family protein [Wenyingzhuangia sp. 2_MG-2023]|uniref:Abi-alpha family protein n=1 Tax=Wenyingzhuangia sp. 2_MG-2023 TaxID=3062639 RepID=UPI0026E23B6F|nr:Abi-alpha family protein [Wenyingzhuangia sp. 2_MG-2023]MDO6739395.1 Abi-alpha family protein [Wenyingzhuangia sp. 2_MG-2023]